MTASFLLMANVTASTKRSPGLVAGKRGAPVTNLTSLAITPLVPVSTETQNMLQLDTPFRTYETFCDGDADVIEGDVLAVSGVEYNVRVVGIYPDSRFMDDDLKNLIVEEIAE